MAKQGGDTRYLVQHNGHPTWHCVKEVPRKLRKAVGLPRLVRSLGTHDVVVARSKRWAVLAEFEAVLEAAKGRASGTGRVSNSSTVLVEHGVAWRDTFARLEAGDPHTVQSFGGRDEVRQGRYGDSAVSAVEAATDVANGLFHDQLVTLSEAHGDDAARVVADIAAGRATPLLAHVDRWLAEGGAKGPLKERTRFQYKADVTGLREWLESVKLAPTLEAVTKAVAGRYVSERLLGTGMDRNTANRKISAPSAYWRWMSKRGLAEANPWAGQSVAKVATPGGVRPKRPLTEAEAATLLDGGADQELADAMLVACLSGMRIEEIFRLTVADAAGGWFDIRASKTRAGHRRVPIHSGLTEVVTRRTDGKTLTDFLFHEAGPVRKGRERSMAVSKRFGGYRKRLGVDDVIEGRRQGRIDFHSWRRRAAACTRNAGIDRAVVAAVLGHEAGNITDDTYAGTPTDTRLRACIEAIPLPVAVVAS